jgi:transposase-like protein
MPKRYAREFRRALCERLVAGEKVPALSEELGVSQATLYLWKRHGLSPLSWTTVMRVYAGTGA